MELHRPPPEIIPFGLRALNLRERCGIRPHGLGAAMQRIMLLDLEAGAQTALFCATQPGLGRAEYWHNTLGRMALAKDDPAANEQAAVRPPVDEALWIAPGGVLG